MKRAFVLTTLLAVAGAALAQTHVLAEAQLPDKATKMIVRDYLSHATVSYIATPSQNFFAYADAGNLMRCMPLDSRYDVRDMKVSGGYLAPTTNENFSCKVEEDPLDKESLPFDFLITEPIETFIIPIEFFCQYPIPQP